MKQKLLAVSVAILAAVVSSCDSSMQPPTTGSIDIVLLTGSGNKMSFNGLGDASAAANDLLPGGTPANILLESVRVTVAGPTNKTMTSNTPVSGFFELNVDQLSPGSYTVTVEGLTGGAVAHFGQTAGVTVTAGTTTEAAVTFPPFQPVITDAAVVDTNDVLRYTVAYGAVSTATSYVIQWSTSPTMAGAQSKTETGTSTEITVPGEGKYYIAVKAVNSTVTAGGLASTPKGVYLFQGIATVTVSSSLTTLNAGTTQQFTAEARDADNNVVAGVNYFWASSNHMVATVSQTGLVSALNGGTATITAVGKGTPGSLNVTVLAAAANKLAFIIQPTSAVAGDPLSPAIQVEIQDAAGNRITNARDGVTIAFSANPGSGVLTGTKTVNAIDGIASFSGISVNKAAAGYTLLATSGFLDTTTSAAFAISPAAPAKLTFGAQPPNAQGNIVFGTATTVTIADQFDNQTTATNNVTLSLVDNPWKTPFATGGVLSGTLTVAANNGTATFSDLRLDKPALGLSPRRDSNGLIGASSNTFDNNLTVTQVSAATSGSHSLRRYNGRCVLLGNHFSGQLGAITGTTGTDSIAALVRGGLHFHRRRTAGGNHSCGITAAGAAYCWGAGSSGRLGNGGTANSDVPVAVIGGHVFASIDAGSGHTCGVTTASGNAAEDRQVYCWGVNSSGQLGDGGVLNTPTFNATPSRVVQPLQTTTRASQVSAGGQHTCVRALDNAVYCWGDNGQGQLGNNVVVPGTDLTVPTLVVGGFLWSSVSAGSNHTCGITTTQIARCWGYNIAGQIGDGTAPHTGVSTPQIVAGSITTWTAISAGGTHTCGIAGASTFCWGENNNGELGDDNSPNDTNQPVVVSGSTDLPRRKRGSQSLLWPNGFRDVLLGEQLFRTTRQSGNERHQASAY